MEQHSPTSCGPDQGLLIHLGVVAGLLRAIGASDVPPETHADRSSIATVALTVAAAAARFGIRTAIG